MSCWARIIRIVLYIRKRARSILFARYVPKDRAVDLTFRTAQSHPHTGASYCKIVSDAIIPLLFRLKCGKEPKVER